MDDVSTPDLRGEDFLIYSNYYAIYWAVGDGPVIIKCMNVSEVSRFKFIFPPIIGLSFS